MSLSEAEPRYERTIPPDILFGEIGKKPAPMTNHGKETTPRMMVVLVGSEMTCEAVDPFRKEGDLNFRRTGILLICPEVRNNRLFSFLS
jgi:hypothetical protein